MRLENGTASRIQLTMNGSIQDKAKCDQFNSWLSETSKWSDKIIWVQKYLGNAAHKRLILSHNKNLNLGDYLIDDRTKNGAAEFKGEHIHFGKEPFPNWQSVLSYLL